MNHSPERPTGGPLARLLRWLLGRVEPRPQAPRTSRRWSARRWRCQRSCAATSCTTSVVVVLEPASTRAEVQAAKESLRARVVAQVETARKQMYHAIPD